MYVKYRILQEITPEGDWDDIGAITHWESEPPHLQLSGIVAHTVSRPIWRAIQERVEEQHLTLDTYHRALGEYERYYRILPEIYELEAETAAEIRRQIREKYVFKYEVPAAQPVAV
ncbi:MAG TPA: hypothetical protein PKD54_12170 [Pirellulaceae bacterium]|nr:hypothetical protein [Pirellulaceae bacterium]